MPGMGGFPVPGMMMPGMMPGMSPYPGMPGVFGYPGMGMGPGLLSPVLVTTFY
jgi:hypothetical protein